MVGRWMAVWWLVFGSVFFFGRLNAQNANGWASAKVDPFQGCDKGGTFVGACSPFGMVTLGPDVFGSKGGLGYQSNKPILGFSFNHTSGSERIGYYGNLLVTPEVGSPNWKSRQAESKTNEKGSPGFYSVTLQRKPGEVEVALTANQNAGRQKYRFRNPGKTGAFPASVLVDVRHTLSSDPKVPVHPFAVEVQPDGSFAGKANFTAVSHPYTLFFSGQVNLKNPTVSYRVDTTRLPLNPGSKKKPAITLDTTGFAFTGLVSESDDIELTVGISYKNPAEARAALARALTQTFEAIQAKAQQAWEDRLSVFKFKGLTEEQEQRFYSALYQTLVWPTDVTGNHPGDQFGESHYWDMNLEATAPWLAPLHGMVYAQNQRRIANTLIRIGEERGLLPNAWVAGAPLKTQGGAAAEIVLADAVVKGLLTGLDAGKAWKVCLKSANQSSDRPGYYGRPAEYLAHGYCSGSVSQSLEYAFNDYVMAAMARKMGREYETEKFRKRSLRVMTLWDPDHKTFRPKDTLGNWKPGTVDASAFLSAPHLTDTIRTLLGGNDAFLARLDSLRKHHPADPNQRTAWALPGAYLYASRPDKAAGMVQQWTETYFASGRNGLPGPEHGGALSAWLIWTYLGLYPVAGTEDFRVYKPRATGIEVFLSGGKVLTVKGTGTLPYWNHKPLPGARLKAADLMGGGVLEWREK